MMNRRTLLKSAAIAGIGSGFLPSSVSAAVKNPIESKKNLVIMVNGLGYYDKLFLPQKPGDLNSSPLLSMLKDHHNDLTVFNKINHPAIVRGHSDTKGVLTCNQKQTNGPYISIDQFACESLKQRSRFKSVNLAKSIWSWDKNSRAVASLFEAGPDKVFEHLFGQPSTEVIQKQLDSLKTYKAKISGKDNRPAYMKSIEAREQSLATDLLWASKPVPKVEFDTNLHLSDNHGRGYMRPFEQQLEMVKLAIKHQRGQVFVVAPPYIDKTSSFGLPASYHALGHRAAKEKPMHEGMLKLEKLLFDDFARFMTSLKKDKLFDDTICLFIGGFNNPGGHSREFIPTVLAGGGFKHQGLIECEKDGKLLHQLSALYVTVLHQMGIDVDEFAQTKGNLDKLVC